MKKTEKAEIKALKSIWYASMCGGLEIKKIDYWINDVVIFVTGAWTSNPSVHTAKIRYNAKWEAYFKHHGYTVKFEDVIRMD